MGPPAPGKSGRSPEKPPETQRVREREKERETQRDRDRDKQSDRDTEAQSHSGTHTIFAAPAAPDADERRGLWESGRLANVAVDISM